MGNFARTEITVTDETMTTSGISTEIPLYVFATASNKLQEESTEIALGTTPEMSNTLLTLTSTKECLQLFGVPSFVEENGTVVQGDERNEYGLLALYDGLRVTNTAYAIRANIDLSQLGASSAEPKGKPVTDKLWLDTKNTAIGLAVSNGGQTASRAWTSVTDYVKLDEAYINVDAEGNYSTDYPVSSVGMYAIGVKNGTLVYFESFKDATWKEIGSDAWFAAKGTSILSGTVSTMPAVGAKCTVCDEELVFGETDVISIDTVATAFERIAGIKATVVNGCIKLASENKIIKLVDGELTPLATLNFALVDGEATAETVKVFFNSSINYPNGSMAGSVWFKTTASNSGMNLIIKKYSASAERWNTLAVPVAGTFTDIEKQIGASILSSSNVGAVYTAPFGDFGLYKFNGSKSMKITGAGTLDSIPAGTLVLKQLGLNNSLRTLTVETTEALAKADFADKFSKAVLEQELSGITMTLDDNGNAVILSDMGTAITLEMTDELANALGIENGEFNHWELVSALIASDNEPKDKPEYGTLWFNNDYVVDIMVSNGEAWVGYKHMYPNASIFVQSNEPEGVAENSLWIDPSAEVYPLIKRRFDNDWEVVDLTDQTSPLGCVFAELRANAGYGYEGSTHIPFSTDLVDLMVSDYVDPEVIDPRSYPAGMICFNTRCSTNNVKKFDDTYVNAIVDLGETYKVGNSIEFRTPGTAENKETDRWICESGNAEDGSGLFGKKAQRKCVVRALAEAIVSNEDLRNENFDIFFVNCAGYPELDDEINSLNLDRKETFYNVTDTPMTLKPNATDIQNWANNANNATSHGEEGRVVLSAYQGRTYPPVALMSNVDGLEVAAPTSIAKMRALLTLPRGQIAAGVSHGTITSVGSVGYITDEQEYAPIQIASNGLGPILTSVNINPILARRNTALMFWGENTENSYTSVLSDEHCILTLCRLKRKLDEASTPFFFRINNQQTRDDFTKALKDVLSEFVGTGEIYDYVLVTDESVNTKQRIQQKQLWAEIAVSLSRGIEYIGIPIRCVTADAI